MVSETFLATLSTLNAFQLRVHCPELSSRLEAETSVGYHLAVLLNVVVCAFVCWKVTAVRRTSFFGALGPIVVTCLVMYHPQPGVPPEVIVVVVNGFGTRTRYVVPCGMAAAHVLGPARTDRLSGGLLRNRAVQCQNLQKACLHHLKGIRHPLSIHRRPRLRHQLGY